MSGNRLYFKKNQQSGVVPPLTALNSSELAVNIADGKIFLKQTPVVNNSSHDKIVTFLNSDYAPYTLDNSISAIYSTYGNNTVLQVYGSILGGYSNINAGAAATIVNGDTNKVYSDFAFIGNGYNNAIYLSGAFSTILNGENNIIALSGNHSSILGGSNNRIDHSNSFILGSNLTSHSPNFTYVHNISAQGSFYGDGSGLTNLATSPAPDTGVRALTANWQSTYAQVSSLSASWGSAGADTGVRALTANWQSTYAQVSSLSASWGSAASGTLTYELSVVDTTQGLYKNGDLIPVGTSIENILINMLKTSVPPTYTSPTLSVAYGSPTVVATYEVGDTISSFTITPTFNANDSGGSTGFVYFKDASNLGTGSSKVVSTFQINSSTTLQVSAGYSQGAIKNDNLGNPYPTGRINAGSTTSTATLNVLYPYFWGKSNTLPTAESIASDIQNGSANKVLASASGTVSVTYNANGEYIWFAHTAAQTEKTKWYVTALNSGSIGNGQAINSPATQNVTSPDAYWSGVSFKIYISSGQQATTGAFEYRNS